MTKFTALDNNIYLTYFKQEEKPWLEKVNDFFSKIREFKSETVINKSVQEYIIKYVVSVNNLLNDKWVRKDLQKYSKSKDEKALEKIKLFIESTDPKQFEKIISDAVYFMKRGRFLQRVFEGRSTQIRILIEENIIQARDCGIKTSRYISALSDLDAEDSIVLSEVYAIKFKHYSSGCFYSEDSHFFEVKKKINPNKNMGFGIKHIKKLKISTD